MRHPDFVEKSILELLEGNFIREVSEPPHCVNPLTVADNKEKLRLVLDLGFVNEFLVKTNFKYEDLRDVVDFLEEGDFFIKFDIKSGYHHIEILEEHKKNLGFFWDFGNVRRFFIFEVLPFGLASASLAFSKMMRVFVKNWRGVGINVVIYIDDGLSASESSRQCRISGSKIKDDLRRAGIVLNQEKSCWNPTQVGSFLGFIVDTLKMELRVPEKKVEALLTLMGKMLLKETVSAKEMARAAGTVISMSPALGPVANLFTRYMYCFIQSSHSWFADRIMPAEAKIELSFWLNNLKPRNGYKMRRNTVTTKVIFSDASEHGFGGYTVTKLGKQIAKGDFSPEEREGSSTLRELLAVKYVLQSFGRLLQNENLLWFTDNMNTPKILKVGSKKIHLTDIALDVFALCLKRNIELRPVWIPREENQVADEISKYKDTDSWGIDWPSFNYLQKCFGKFTIDRFADHINNKVKKFNSRFFCPGTDDVDAFTTQWKGHFNYICPPVSQIGRAIRHCRACKAHGVLVCPEWKASYFWPLLVVRGSGNFRNFIKGVRVLDPFFITFNDSSRSNVFNGHASFRTLALHIAF